MFKIITILMALTLTCIATDTKYITKVARVTYYWPNNGGQVGTQTSTGIKAVCGKSAAVDPKIIPYGSEIYIPKMGKTLKAVDTGSAVKNRTASKKLGKDNIVIDIFCGSKAEALRRIKKYPMFMEIKIKK
jgi:3D (Asp-Asp-Asp) domain-containing protein